MLSPLERGGKHSVWVSVMSLLSSVSHGFIDGFWRRLRILVAKTKDFWQRLRISLSLPMFTVHTNEQGMCTCLH